MRIILLILIVITIFSIISLSGCMDEKIDEKPNFTVTITTIANNHLKPNCSAEVTVKNKLNISKENIFLIVHPSTNSWYHLEEKSEPLGVFNPNEIKILTIPLGEGPTNCKILFDYDIYSTGKIA